MIQFIGIPHDTLDCWELACKLYRELLGIELGLRDSDENARRLLNWQPIQKGKEQKYDLLVFSDYPGHKHVGVVLKPGRFLHSTREINSCIDRYRDVQWTNRLKSIYRHKSLMYTVS